MNFTHSEVGMNVHMMGSKLLVFANSPVCVFFLQPPTLAKMLLADLRCTPGRLDDRAICVKYKIHEKMKE